MGLFRLAAPAFFALPPEQAHSASISALKSGLIRPPNLPLDGRLGISLAGLAFPNPIGLAAGYDKNAEVPDAILRLGFGFAEVGTVTPRPQSGNPRPRVFRLVQDEAVINRLGFNNQGHAAALARLTARSHNSGIVGVNIGANKDSEDFVADYELGIETFYRVASYFTANISSPNTPGLRNLQAKDALEVLLNRIFEKVTEMTELARRSVPVFLKVAPDLTEQEIDEIASVIDGTQLSALIVSNTTLDREMLSSNTHAKEVGGLSGKPVFAKSTKVLARFYQRLGEELPLIGVGGVSSASDAIAKIQAGASLVQLYTGMVYKGPGLPTEIVRGLSRHLDTCGAKSISEIIGTNADAWAD